jgi:hypothetical protein
MMSLTFTLTSTHGPFHGRVRAHPMAEPIEYCALMYEDDKPDSKCVVVQFSADGSIKQKTQRERGAGIVIAELDSAGWRYAFEDKDGLVTQVFFKRATG